MAYDAYCLANFGVDRYLNHFPIYLINFGGGQSALMAYLVALFIKVTGTVNLWIIRLPIAIIAILAYLAGSKLLKEEFGEKWGLFGSFLLAIVPYFIMQSRFGLDCNLLVNLTTISLYFLRKAIKNDDTFYFIISGLIFGLSYYTYAISYISISLFLIVSLIYLLYVKKIKIKNIIACSVPVILLGIPLLLMLIINQFNLQEINLLGFTIPKLGFYRGSEISFSNLANNFIVTIKSILTNDWIPYNAFKEYFTLYAISIPFILFGFAELIKKFCKSVAEKKYDFFSLVLFLFLANIITFCLLGGNGPNVNKCNGIFFTLFICLIEGIIACYLSLKKIDFHKTFILSLSILYLFNFVDFANYYFFKYPNEVYPQYLFSDMNDELMGFAYDESKKVWIDNSYIYYFLVNEINPYEANIAVNGTSNYKNIIFGIPNVEESEKGIYVIHKTNTFMIEKFKVSSADYEERGNSLIFEIE